MSDIKESRAAKKKINKFEEYKLFVEDTARLTDRRQSISNIYITVNSILITGIALLLNESEFDRRAMAISVLSIVIAGLTICKYWLELIQKYKALSRLRFNELKIMEEQEGMEGNHQMYHMEEKLYPADEIQKHVSISDLERRLPQIFIFLYSAFGLGIIAALFLRLI